MTTQNSDEIYYETSTWTPTVVGQGTAGTTTYNAQNGYFTRIGNIIFCFGYVDIASATGSGNFLLGGLPYTISNSSGASATGTVAYATGRMAYPASRTNLCLIGIQNSKTANIACSASAQTQSLLQIANTASQYYFQITYFI